MEKLYSTKQVAELTGYAHGTIKQYVHHGQLKGVKYGRFWKFTENQIKEFLDDKKKEGSK